MKQLFNFLFLIVITSCTSDNEEDYFNINGEDCNTEDVYYISTDDTKSISFIVSNKCLTCHQSGGDAEGYPLDYQKLSIVYGSMLLDIINGKANGIDIMPQEGSPQLTDCEKLKIESWVNNGFLYDEPGR